MKFHAPTTSTNLKGKREGALVRSRGPSLPPKQEDLELEGITFGGTGNPIYFTKTAALPQPGTENDYKIL